MSAAVQGRPGESGRGAAVLRALVTGAGVGFFAATALALPACGPASKCGPDSALVREVVDGDTLVLDLDGGVKVRLLLVNAPEITEGKNECWGRQAADFTGGLVAGRVVSLKYDEASCKDRFGRLLAYVSVDGKEVNTELAKQGYACFMYVAPGGEARTEEFRTWVSEATTNRTGMWGACTDIPCAAKQ